MNWNPFKRAEKRSSNYSDLMIQQALARATDSVTSSALLPVESAVSLIERCFSVAEVEGLMATPGQANITPESLGAHARRMILRGESVGTLTKNLSWRIDPASSWDVYGQSPDPTMWTYHLNTPTPTGYSGATLPASMVVHFRWGTDLSFPWRGRSPLDNGALSSSAAAALEASIKYELGVPTGRIIPIPAGAPTELIDGLRRDLTNMKGAISLPETVRAGFGAGMGASPLKDYQAEKLGPAPDQSLVEIRKQFSADLVSAIGVPPLLCGIGSASEKDSREGYRRFLHSTLKPIGQIIANELSLKLMRPVSINFDSLAAADVSGRARAFKSLTESGMTPDQASRLVGFDSRELM